MDLLETLLAIERRRRDAWINRDRGALAALLDEGFMEINYLGRLSKAEVLDQLFNRVQLKDFTITRPSLCGGEEFPILTYACFEQLLIDGNPVEGHFHVASHFFRRGSDWKILLWQITPWMNAPVKS